MLSTEILNKMGEFQADKEKLIKFMSGCAVMGNGNVLWYDGTIEELFAFIDKWIFKEMVKGESSSHEACSHWHDGYCWGTKDADSCSCGGNSEKCDYYGNKCMEEKPEDYYGRTWEDMDRILCTMLEIEDRNYHYKPEEQEAFNIALMLISEKMNTLKYHKPNKS